MNNSKQTVLSIVGIAILVIAVVGVSFAFFTYSRTGTTNNVITTGSITFTSNNDTAPAVTISNDFPQSSTYDGTGRDAYTFSVTGTIPTTAQTVYYKVTAVPGDAVSGKTPFASNQINIRVTGARKNDETPQTGDGSFDVTDAYEGTTGGALPSDMTTGTIIAKGSVGNNGYIQTHQYSVKMWVNSSVTISDTSTAATYRAKRYVTAAEAAADNTLEEWTEGLPRDNNKADKTDGATYDNREVYSDKYYSLKVDVEAKDNGPY